MKTNEKSSSISQGFLWFGAAISIAEILTGALLAPLGLARGLLAVLVGHLIGFGIFYLTGLIGAESGLSAIESTRISFGKYGALWFSLLNVVQLLGWTAVMIINGARALDAVVPAVQGGAVWCAVIGGLICVWILVGRQTLAKLSAGVASLLFLFTLVLGFVVFRGMSSGGSSAAAGGLRFGAAIELSVTMPLSWLPLISDYTRFARHPRRGSLMSAAGYTLGSCMMYVIGLGAALYTGTDDIAAILLGAGLGAVALLIVILSTVTTTFLDAWSGGVSLGNLSPKIPEKWAALGVCAAGTVMAMAIPINQYENFLYLIGSVFAPLFALLITDYFLLRVRKIDGAALNLQNMLLWALGFALYRLLLGMDSPLGATLPTMLFVAALRLAAARLPRRAAAGQR